MIGYRWRPRTSSSGRPYWEAVPTVARIRDEYVKSLAFFYRTVEEAETNENCGGSGFLLGKEFSDQEGRAHVYAVTNLHVKERGGLVMHRMDRDGTWIPPEDLSQKHWEHIPGQDIAVCSLGRSALFSDVPMIRATSLLAESEMEDQDDPDPYREPPDYGSEVFMVSRLGNRDLRAGSVPAVRFGSLAAHRPVLVWNERCGFDQESFLVEMRSISGHSGSPVLLYIDPLRLVAGVRDERSAALLIRLLGINWGHLDQDAPTGGWNAGIACVVPAWRIAQLLEESEVLVAERDQREREHRSDAQIPSGGAVADELGPDDEFGRFRDLTRKLTQVPKSEIDEKRQES